MIKLKKLILENSFKTMMGSSIRRYKDNVGKNIGGNLYVHKKYARDVIPNILLNDAIRLLSQKHPEFKYNCITWMYNDKAIRFDESPDFDSAREPHVGCWVSINSITYDIKTGHSNAIWHHKWMWVKDDYTGFDVNESKEWSKLWLSKLHEPAKGTDVSWDAQLKKYGLLNENKELLMEGKNILKIEDLLRDSIKGTEWENKVFTVGGYVRDLVMGRPPKDCDIVVDKPNGGILFATWWARKLGIYKEASNPSTFPRFGTANVRLDGVVYDGADLSGEEVQAVMPRSEQYNDPNSRKPDVQYTDLKGDAERRDLTVNAIYKNVSTGEIVDPVGGISDINGKVLRPPGDPDLIYTDDALRMFRVIRFATQFRWDLTPDVIAGIKRNLSRLNNTSKERIRDELNKILLSEDPARGFRMLKDVGLLPYVSKELQQAVGMTQNKYHSQDVFDHIMTVLSKTKPTLIARIGALLHDVGKVTTRSVVNNEVHFYEHERVGADIARKMMEELKYPSNIIEPVVLAIKNHMRLKQAGAEGEVASDKTLRKFAVDIGDHLDDVMDIMHADNLAHSDGNTMPNQIPNIIKRIEALKTTIPVKGEKLPVTGGDLQTLGLKPGPLYKELLNLVKDKQLENPNTTKEEYLDLIKKHLKMV